MERRKTISFQQVQNFNNQLKNHQEQQRRKEKDQEKKS